MKTKKETKAGYALVTVIGIMAVMTITFSVLMTMGKQNVFTGKIMVNNTKAVAYAEAGIEYAYAIIRANFDSRKDPSAFWTNTNTVYQAGAPLTTQYEDGSFTLKLTLMDNARYVIVNSTGICGDSSVEVETMVEDSNFGSLSAWDVAIYAGGTGDSTITGGGYIDSAGNLKTVHFNGDIKCGGNTDVKANISTAGSVSLIGTTALAGTTAEGADIVSPPKLEDKYSSFATYSKSADEILLNQDYTLSNNDSHTVGGDGIMYVDGKVTIKGAFTGTIICTEGITLQSGGYINAGSSGIAVATQTGSITYNTSGNSTGLFFAEVGDFDQGAAQGDLTGQILVGGIVKKTGGSGITFDGGGSTQTDVNPVIAGWQK